MKKISKILRKALVLLCALVISVPTVASTVQGDASSFKMIFAPDEGETISGKYPSIHPYIYMSVHLYICISFSPINT